VDKNETTIEHNFNLWYNIPARIKDVIIVPKKDSNFYLSLKVYTVKYEIGRKIYNACLGEALK